MSGNMLSDAVHRAIYGVAAIAAVGLPASAQAQDQEDDVILEEIITTGSRIPVDANLVSTSPVTTVDSEELAFSGVTRVEDLVNDLPQVTPELTSNDSNGSTGTATLDLRGLGSNRTLTLINGHRMGFGDPFALAPDINQIPGHMVERVELLTGGASSTYGSDAVAGVVNFIMKKDFEGFQIDYQVSGYQHDNDNGAAQAEIAAAGYEQAPGDVSDGKTTDISLTVGMNSADGRGNVTGYVGYRDIEAIRHSERDYSACALGGSAGTVGNCRGSSTTPLGSFRNFADIDLTLDPANPGTFVDRAGMSYNYGPLNYFQRPDERWTAGMFANYEMSDTVEAYAEFQFMDDRSLAQIAPSGTFFNNSVLNCDNPLMSNQQLAAIGCPGVGPSATTVPIYVGRRNVEGGPRFDDLQHQSSRSLVGFRGEIGDNWQFDAFINFAQLNYSEVYNNDLSITNIVRSLDIITDPGTGQPACRSAVSGLDPLCVPYDVFNVGGSTAAARNYIDLPLFSKADLDMAQGVAYVTGDLGAYGWQLPSADDGVQFVFGLEYRDDQFVFDLDQNYNNGNAAGQGGATADVSGEVLVKEFFTEARIPLVQDRPGFEDLSLDLRYRNSDYDIGVDADTWNVGVAWSPTEDFKFRASTSRAVRAPDISELFSPQTIGLWQGTDPCAGPTPVLTEAQCALTGVPAGSYGSVAPNPADQYNGLFGGNPDLGAEESDSLTVGFLATPSFAPGLTVSVDYWQIEIEDAISTIDPEFAITQCGLTGDATFCDLIRRSPVNGNVWVGSSASAPRVVATNVNIGGFDVAGWDIDAGYVTEFGNHGLEFKMRGTLLDTWDEIPQPGADAIDCVGVWGATCGRPRPEWKHTFSTMWATPVEGLDVVGTWRMMGEVDEESDPGVATRVATDSQHYFDLSAGYSFEWGGGQTQVTVGINNIIDEEPPVHGLFNTAPYSNGNTIPGAWDPLGRYWFAGITYSR
ncbi:MAG: TonB-dependent receptor plug domain-containing protein [Woeseiaceae bacterium]